MAEGEDYFNDNYHDGASVGRIGDAVSSNQTGLRSLLSTPDSNLHPELIRFKWMYIAAFAALTAFLFNLRP